MENKVETDLEKKQAFLRSEIMEKKYDTEKFSDFLSKFKDDGLDLSNWVYEELQQAVYQFQANCDSNKGEENINEEKEIENVRNSFKLNPSIINEIINNPSNEKNPYDKIFDKNEIGFENIENVMSDLNKNDDDELNNNNNLIQKKQGNDNEVGGFILVDSNEIPQINTGIIDCVKQKENSLTKYNDIYVTLSE